MDEYLYHTITPMSDLRVVSQRRDLEFDIKAESANLLVRLSDEFVRDPKHVKVGDTNRIVWYRRGTKWKGLNEWLKEWAHAPFRPVEIHYFPTRIVFLPGFMDESGQEGPTPDRIREFLCELGFEENVPLLTAVRQPRQYGHSVRTRGYWPSDQPYKVTTWVQLECEIGHRCPVADCPSWFYRKENRRERPERFALELPYSIARGTCEQVEDFIMKSSYNVDEDTRMFHKFRADSTIWPALMAEAERLQKKLEGEQQPTTD